MVRLTPEFCTELLNRSDELDRAQALIEKLGKIREGGSSEYNLFYDMCDVLDEYEEGVG